MVALKKQNLKASEYAKRTINELFTEEIFKNSIMKEAVTGKSVIAINQGGGKFTIQNLPSRVQLSCVCGISCTDINNDGNIDLIMGGNNFEFKPYSRVIRHTRSRFHLFQFIRHNNTASKRIVNRIKFLTKQISLT